MIDPAPKGKGYGLAPIGHTVTIEKADPVTINYRIEVTMMSGHNINEIQTLAENAIKQRLLLRAKEWCNQDEKEHVILRTSLVTALMVELPNVLDVGRITINGASVSKLELKDNQIPVVGTITLVAV